MSDKDKTQYSSKEQEKIEELLKENEELKAQVDAYKKAKAKSKRDKAALKTLSHEELVTMLTAYKRGDSVDGRGNYCKRQDSGVYCQFNRPETEGSTHLYLKVPETFHLETYEPPKE